MEKAPFSMQCTGSAPSYAIFQNSDMCYLCFGPLNQAPINYYSVILLRNITIIIIYALFLGVQIKGHQRVVSGAQHLCESMRCVQLMCRYVASVHTYIDTCCLLPSYVSQNQFQRPVSVSLASILRIQSKVEQICGAVCVYTYSARSKHVVLLHQQKVFTALQDALLHILCCPYVLLVRKAVAGTHHIFHTRRHTGHRQYIHSTTCEASVCIP